MDALKTKARKAGALYFLTMIAGIASMLVFPRFTVPGDAAATAANILGSELTFRFGILLDLFSGITFILVAASLYSLFKAVDRWNALLVLVLVVVSVTFSFANLLNKFAPLILLSGDGYWSVFDKPQLETLAMGFLSLHRDGLDIAMIFWGLWLFPFGYLVIKSGFFPKFLGYSLYIAGIAYLINSLVSIAIPDARAALSKFLMPLYFGEVPIILWLFLKGAKEPQSPPMVPLAV